MISGNQRQFSSKCFRTTNNVRLSVAWRQAKRLRKPWKEQT